MDGGPATLRAFNAQTYKADIQPIESPQGHLAAVQVSRAIPAGEMVLGRRVCYARFWPNDPEAIVVLGVW